MTILVEIDPEFSQAIPPLHPEELAQLEANLLANGCREPLVRWQETNLLLDGHNRRAICLKHQLTFRTTDVSLPDREAALNWIDTNQLGRRNLTPDQISLLRGRIYNRIKRQGERTDLTLCQNVTKFTTAEKLGDQHGVSSRTIKRDGAFAEAVEQLQPIAPTLTRQVFTSKSPPKIAVMHAAILLESHPEKAHAILNGHLTMAKVKRDQRREKRLASIAEQTRTPPDLGTLGQFAVLYADPPWRYEHNESEVRAIENHYPTMALTELCDLPIADLAYDDAILFLWSTSPKVAEALRLMEAWGFTYRTCAVWDKEQFGMGYYFRQQHELLLVGTRGTIPPPAPSDRPRSVLRIPRSPEHSAKPKEVYAMIELMYPTLRKIELFARDVRDGWVSWGNQR